MVDAIRRRCGQNGPVSCSPLSVDAIGAAEGSPDSNGPIRVLVADDDARVRGAIGQTIALEADLVLVASAADAPAALAGAERTSPAVALLDVLLPDADSGLALVTSLAQRPGGAVVAMSIRSGLRSAALAAGAVSFVEKGGDIQAVLDALRAAASPRRA
jgi:DNA-binding NarL/FixJ family response regulator